MLPNEPTVLLSYINTKLRDEFSSLEDLCDALDEDMEAITEKLSAAGYKYNEEQNQFK